MAAPPPHRQAHVKRMTSVLETGRYSDLMLTCQGREFAVHRVVLCTASKFFAAACDGDFMEASEGKIELDEDDPAAVERMLKYLYVGDYDDGNPSSETPVADSAPENGAEQGDNQDIVSEPPSVDRAVATSFNNITVYALAEKYDIQDLKDLAKEKFRGRSASHLWRYSDLFDALEVIYSNTPSSDRGLRDIISKLCANTNDEEDLLEKPRFRELMSKDGSMALDVLVESRKKHALDCGVLEGQLDRKRTQLHAAAERNQHLRMLADKDQEIMKNFIQNGASCPFCKLPSHLAFQESERTEARKAYVYCESSVCHGQCVWSS